MKRLLSTALVLSLLTGASALAAPQDDHHDNRGGGQPPRAAPAAPPAAAPARPQAVQPQAGQQRGPGWEHNGQNAQAQAVPQGPQRGPQQGQGPQRGPGWEHNGQNGPNGQFRGQAVPQQGFQRGPGGPGGRPQAVRPQDRAQRDFNRPRFDPHRWQFRNTPSRRFHWRGPAWVPPVGFYPHSWVYGEILPWAWYTPNYYIDDWNDYGLPIAPYGCEWVREGADALLVDVYTGRVLSVEYGIFY